MSSRSRDLVKRSVPHLSVDYITVDESTTSDLPTYGYQSRATYGRLFIGDLLPPDLSRVLYLDCDLIVLDDLLQLTEFDMQGFPIAAVVDSGAPVFGHGMGCWREAALDPRTAYFNAGVMLIDLDEWRTSNIGGRSLDAIGRFAATITFGDQDVLNLSLNGNFSRLPLHWNQIHVLRQGGHQAYNFASASEVDEAMFHPKIVHFTGIAKPWHRQSTDPMRDAWREVHKRTLFHPLRLRNLGTRDRLLHAGISLKRLITE